MMKRKAILFVIALLVLMPFTAMANASSTACDLKITKFTVHPATGVAPAKIGLTTYMAGTVKRVQYQVLDKSGKVVASCSSFCSHCTKQKICTCSLVVKQAGTYDVKVTAYGTGSCSVTQVKKAAIKISSGKSSTISPDTSSTNFVPGFKSIISGKKVTFKDTTSGTKPIKWNWNFGDDYRSTLQNPTHTYKKAGTYTVYLTVYNTGNSYKSVSNRIVIR
jgi:PKD repeat protein